jgi:Rieske Fe-S protein
MKKSSCEGCTRRAVLERLGLGTAGVLLLSSCAPNGSTVDLGTTTTCGAGTCVDLADPTNAPLTTVGGALLVEVGSDTVMVIRTADAQVIAVSAICTHAGCTVGYNAAASTLDCPCHGARYDETGHVIRGPAVRDLRLYSASLAQNVVTIS